LDQSPTSGSQQKNISLYNCCLKMTAFGGWILAIRPLKDNAGWFLKIAELYSAFNNNTAWR